VIRLDPAIERFLLNRPLRVGVPTRVRDRFVGERVLVTGAGGSIGAELARQLATCYTGELVLFDHAEYQLFRIVRELERDHPAVRVHPVLGDVSRARDVLTACQLHRPRYVFHAAAYKHVTLAERAIVAATRTNVLGAVNTARAASAVHSRFVLVSTDKAAAPQSVMGATKRLAEMCVLGRHAAQDAIAVRFGNVLGSSGSVVEILIEAARDRRALTVTDPEATRFFMTAAEAVALVLNAATAAKPREIFWLDMGRPLRLADLVSRIVDAFTPAGASPSPVRVIGLRPGEKRHEVLTSPDLPMESTDDAAIWRAEQPLLPQAATCIARLRAACRAGDSAAALHVMADAVKDYRPSTDALEASRAPRRRDRSALRATRRAPAASTVPIRRYA
jgi:FlaA1/EpsC-like NDP-sugar epimerase